jgi:choline dehydrogenase-like flavoprotein
MIIENSRSDIPPDADVLIVGAGPVGLALAFKCAGQGLSVILLESGSSDEEGNGKAWLGDVEIVTPHHAALEAIRCQGIGGTSRLWGGRCVALDDIDFEKRDHVPFSGWPIPHAEIANHYGEALTFLGCGTDAAYPKNPGRATQAEITIDMPERWSAEPDLRRRHGERLRTSDRIMVYARCTVTSIRLDNDGSRVAALIVTRGDRPFEVTAKSYVLAGGGLENARLLLLAQRHWPQKFGGQNGPLGRFYCGHLSGHLAAIRFNQQSFAKSLWYQKSSDGSHLRHRLAPSPDAQRKHALLNAVFWLDSFSVGDPAHGSGALSMLYVGLALLGLYPRLGNGLAPSPTEPRSRGLRRHLSNVRRDPKLLSSTLSVFWQLSKRRLGQRAFALVNPDHRYLLRYHAEQVPSSESRVFLANEQDRGATQNLRVDFRFQQQDVESVVRSHEILDDWLQRENIGRLDYLTDANRRGEAVLKQALDGYHQIGLTRMADDPKTGVVDRNCRVHDVANLFVAGSSVFPTAGQANPTLPAVALALRLGDYLRRTVRATSMSDGPSAPCSSDAHQHTSPTDARCSRSRSSASTFPDAVDGFRYASWTGVGQS